MKWTSLIKALIMLLSICAVGPPIQYSTSATGGAPTPAIPTNPDTMDLQVPFRVGYEPILMHVYNLQNFRYTVATNEVRSTFSWFEYITSLSSLTCRLTVHNMMTTRPSVYGLLVLNRLKTVGILHYATSARHTYNDLLSNSSSRSVSHIFH